MSSSIKQPGSQSLERLTINPISVLHRTSLFPNFQDIISTLTILSKIDVIPPPSLLLLLLPLLRFFFTRNSSLSRREKNSRRSELSTISVVRSCSFLWFNFRPLTMAKRQGASSIEKRWWQPPNQPFVSFYFPIVLSFLPSSLLHSTALSPPRGSFCADQMERIRFFHQAKPPTGL